MGLLNNSPAPALGGRAVCLLILCSLFFKGCDWDAGPPSSFYPEESGPLGNCAHRAPCHLVGPCTEWGGHWSLCLFVGVGWGLDRGSHGWPSSTRQEWARLAHGWLGFWLQCVKLAGGEFLARV